MLRWFTALLVPSLGFNQVPCEDVRVFDCGHDFFREVHQQFQDAKEEIVIMSFFMRPRLKMFTSQPGPSAAPDLSLTDLVVAAVKRQVHVWLMGWDNSASEKVLGYFQDHEYELLFEAAGTAHRNFLHLMLDTGRQFLGSVFYLPHIKSIVFDRSVAFVGGIDFTENRDDTWRHRRPNGRLVQLSQDQRHPTGNEKPWQDAMARIEGRVAEQVAMVLVERWWNLGRGEGLDPNPDVVVRLSLGQQILVNISGLQALDRQIPQQISFNFLGRRLSASSGAVTFDVYGAAVTAQWLPEGLEATPEALQRCKVVMSGSNMWMGTTSTMKDAGHAPLALQRLKLENQYFSSDFPSASAECQHTHDPARAVLYSGAGNRLGEVLLDRIKRAVLLKEEFSVAFVFPLGTEPGAFYPNLRGAYCFEDDAGRGILREAVENFCRSHGVERWRDYFSFFFLANAVEVPKTLSGSGAESTSAAFYGVYTHSKIMVADDNIAYVGSANINDRSLLGNRDAELGAVIWGGAGRSAFPEKPMDWSSLSLESRFLAATALLRGHHLGDLGYPKLNTARFAATMNEVANGNAEELRETMGISFPDGTFTRGGAAKQLFGMEGLLNHAPLEDAAIPYPRSRVVAGGGGTDHWDWFQVDVPRAPRLNGQLFPWSRKIWGMPAMTQIAQIFSKDFNYLQTSATVVQSDSQKPLFL
eukprot:s2372_g9.t1